MGATNPDLGHVIDPELLTDYVTAMYFESAAFARSGIVGSVTIPNLREFSEAIEMPSWNIIPEMQRLTPGNDITLNNLQDKREIHPVVRLFNGIQNLDVAALIAKDDPNAEVSRQIATNTAIGWDDAYVATLQGGAASNTGNQVADTAAPPAATDITALQNVFADIFVQVMGGGTKGTLAMRSAVHNAYRELGLIGESTLGGQLQNQIANTGTLGNILGSTIIIDDQIHRGNIVGTSLSLTTGDALTYLCGMGSINSSVQREILVEQDRDVAKKSTIITWDVHRTSGTKGMDWTLATDGKGPTNADLRAVANWSLKAEDSKLVAVSSIQTNHP